MLEGFTDEELREYAKECQKKYENLEVETLKKALTGEIGTNAKMVEALEELNRHFLDEMEQFVPYASDLNPQTIENFKQAEEDGENVIVCARQHLELLEICEKVMNGPVYVNEDGKISDENGVPLNKDGEHSLFEVIKGGGSGETDTTMAPAPMMVVKGD